MDLIIEIVKTKRDLRKFIMLPEQLHSRESNWIPPIYADEWKFYNPRYNKAIQQCDSVLFIASRNGVCCGRVMGIIHKPYNEIHREQTARFFNLECEPNADVLHSLMEAIEQWALSKGMYTMVGPFGFSDKDPEGLQVEGFEFLPVIATATNRPYLPPLLEGEGYQKKIDCLVYKLEVPLKIPEAYHRVYDRIIRNKDLKLFEFKKRAHLKPFIVPVLRLVNETYKSLYGFIPMDEQEMQQLADKYLPMLDPEFTKVIVNAKGEPVAFVVASPDFSVGIKSAKGKLFPFGFLHILAAMRKATQLDLFLGAIKENYQNKGVTALLGVPLLNAARRRGFKFIDSHLILETNKPMRSVLERLGAKVYKRYRVYQKNIS